MSRRPEGDPDAKMSQNGLLSCTKARRGCMARFNYCRLLVTFMNTKKPLNKIARLWRAGNSEECHFEFFFKEKNSKCFGFVSVWGHPIGQRAKGSKLARCSELFDEKQKLPATCWKISFCLDTCLNFPHSTGSVISNFLSINIGVYKSASYLIQARHV